MSMCDKDGDQIALPCTERLFTEKVAAQVGALGVIPVVSLRGRPEVRVASFNAVSGKPIAGRWAPVEVGKPARNPPQRPSRQKAPAAETEGGRAGSGRASASGGGARGGRHERSGRAAGEPRGDSGSGARSRGRRAGGQRPRTISTRCSPA